MQDYVSAQTYATRSAGNSRFGFAWSPRNLAGMPTAEFAAQTDALLVRLAVAIADSADAPEAACGSSWCTGTLDGAVATPAWQTFATWKPSVLVFTTPTQTLSPGVPSAPFTVELRTSVGTPYSTGLSLSVELRSSSPTGELSLDPAGPWTPTLTASIASGQGATSFYVRDGVSGPSEITAAAAGKVGATQAVTVAELPSNPARRRLHHLPRPEAKAPPAGVVPTRPRPPPPPRRATLQPSPRSSQQRRSRHRPRRPRCSSSAGRGPW